MALRDQSAFPCMAQIIAEEILLHCPKLEHIKFWLTTGGYRAIVMEKGWDGRIVHYQREQPDRIAALNRQLIFQDGLITRASLDVWRATVEGRQFMAMIRASSESN